MLFPFLLASFSTSRIVFKRNAFHATRSAATLCIFQLCCFSKPLHLTGNVAAAFGSSLLAETNAVIQTTRNRRLSLLASATTNDNNNNNNDYEKAPEGKTGWNHNPPKNPDFWNTEDASAAEEVESIAKSIAATEKTAESRTGWLHNTVSADQKKAASRNGNNGDSSAKKKSSAAGKARRRLEEAMKAQQQNHRIVSPGALHACGKDRQIVVTEHRMAVPLVYDEEEDKETKVEVLGGAARPIMPKPGTKYIDVAFTIVEEIKDEDTRIWYESEFPGLTPSQRATAYVKRCGMTSAGDMLVYLQGGPGFGAPTPVVGLDFSKGGSSWGSAALDKYKRLVFMDQRGTGKSSPVTKQSLEHQFPDQFSCDDDCRATNTGGYEIPDDLEEELFQKQKDSVAEATEFMAQFRADSIVRDAELIKDVLMYTPSVDDEDADDYDDSNKLSPNPWGCCLGQSFGGFCTMTYLSQIQHPPKICLLTGGIAPMLEDPVDVYLSLWDKVKERSLRYYDMYPDDVAVVKTIVRKLMQAEEDGNLPRLPSGGKLSAVRFLQLGMSLGGGPTSFATMHDLLSSAFLQPLIAQKGAVDSEFTRGFLKAIDTMQPFDEHPIYFFMHESIYADQNRGGTVATNWSADRAYEIKKSGADGAEYDYAVTSREDSAHPVLFLGEMVFPWMGQSVYAETGGFGCSTLAEALAKKDDWGPLYDADTMRSALADGKTRAAAAVYYDDMYVDFGCCRRVLARGGPLEKCKAYVTNEYQHSGLRDDGATIFNKLHGMATGATRVPS